jgi:hypothetical protein
MNRAKAIKNINVEIPGKLLKAGRGSLELK